MSTTDTICASCGNSIETGHVRHPTDEGPIHDGCQKRRDARASYKAFVTNPQYNDGIEWSLWYDHGDFESPFITTGNAGTTINSISADNGTAPPLSDGFIKAIGYGYHHTKAMMDPSESEIDNIIETFYDHPVPDHERWAIHTLVRQMFFAETLVPEFREIVAYTETCTEWGVPEVEPSPLE